MSTFYICEIIQFIIGLTIVLISFVVIVHQRESLLEAAFGDELKVRKSFTTLTSMGYFLIFIPILLIGINLTSPPNYNLIKHIQRIIYSEAGLLFLIGILHVGVMVVFSSKVKFNKSK